MDKSLAGRTSQKRTASGMRSDAPTDGTDVKRIREDYEQLDANEFDTLDFHLNQFHLNQFLEKHKLPEVTQEESGNLNSYVSIKGLVVAKSF